MTPKAREDKLRRREQELQERERSLRLRELEAEINQPPLLPTRKHDRPVHTQRQRGLIKVAKFAGLVVLAAVVINVLFRVAAFLAAIALVSVVGWAFYKFFLERDPQA